MIFYTPRKGNPSGITDLSPVRVMDPYKPCWCGSGLKWKWCHKDREKMPPPVLGRLLSDLRRELKNGYCSHPDAPHGCGILIRAHTVQRAAGLAAIAEAGHVLSPLAGLQRIEKSRGRIVPERIGINDASTFMGFCDTHDSSFFRPAEHGQVALSDEVACLLSYRSIAYEAFMKVFAERSIYIQREADKGQPFEAQAEIQAGVHWYAQGTRLAVRDTLLSKATYETALRAADFSQFSYVAVQFDDVLPVVACGGLTPEFDFKGNALQWLGNTSRKQQVAFNLTVLDGRSIAVFGWLGQGEGPGLKFLKSLGEVPAARVADAVTRFAFEHLENIYLRPSWWEGLEEHLREALLTRIHSGMPHAPERTGRSLTEDGLSYYPTAPIAEVHTRLP